MVDSSLDLSPTSVLIPQGPYTSTPDIDNSRSSSSSLQKMASASVLSREIVQRQLPKSSNTSFFIRDLLMKDACIPSPKADNSPTSSSDEHEPLSGQEREHHSLSQLNQLYGNGHLPNGLSYYFDHCLSQINQTLQGVHSSTHKSELKNNADSETRNEPTGLLINEGECLSVKVLGH